MRVALLLLAASLGAQDIYDLLLKNGHVIDPKNKRNERLDIGVSKGRIVKIAKGIPAAHARRVVDASDYYVTPGLLDIQTVANAEHNSLRSGVTTVATNAAAVEHSRVKLVKAPPAGERLTRIYGPEAPNLAEARKKGLLLDVAHGANGFVFRVAVPALKAGMLPDLITTDMTQASLLLPRATMSNVMSKFLAMGLTMEQVVERTTVNTAKAVHRPELGSLEVGRAADIALLELRTGRAVFIDTEHRKLTANRELRCVLTVLDGVVVWDSEGLSLTNWKDAGPYSNYK